MWNDGIICTAVLVTTFPFLVGLVLVHQLKTLFTFYTSLIIIIITNKLFKNNEIHL